ncbi:MAG: tetratricopeptide (TPR) repeat protein [Lentimonas sp.]|jgi:tetratricopeptide (TPR) repeat protein
MLKIYASISLFFFVGQGALLAQGGYSSAPTSNAPQFGQGSVSAPLNTSLESNTFLEMASRVFDPNSDSMDFENGSFAWKGKNFNLTEQRVFRARFERFLLSEPTQNESDYAELMDAISRQLSVANERNEETIMEAWQMLFRAADFDIDGGNSTIIANQVFNAWRIYKETRGTSLSQNELLDLRRFQQEVVANRTATLKKIQQRKRADAAPPVAAASESSNTNLPTEAAFRALDLAETEAKLLALEGQAAATGLQAKLQFQSQIVAFVIQRRFQHALLLSNFYQLLFKGSHQKLEVGKSELASFFPSSDLSFTVDTITFVANEAINDISRGVSAFEMAYSEERTMIALERLQETFFLGEYSTELNGISVEQRRRILDLYRLMIEAGELAEAKDYNGVTESVNSLAELAADFPKSRLLSSVETAKSMSDMAVFAASQYRNIGDIDRARAELQQAVEIWPSNPAIRDFQLETTKLATAGSTGIQVFDDLYSRGDFRSIYERRMTLGFALNEDARRLPLLMKVIEQVSTIDLLLMQSAEAVKQGDPYVAWELLVEASHIDPDDAPMNRARAELAPRVADFVVQLDRAQRQANDGFHASALMAYFAAQDIYPASRISRIGIEQSSQALMDFLGKQAIQVAAEEISPLPVE